MIEKEARCLNYRSQTQYTAGIASGATVTFISIGNDFQGSDLKGFLDIISFLLGESNLPYGLRRVMSKMRIRLV